MTHKEITFVSQNIHIIELINYQRIQESLL